VVCVPTSSPWTPHIMLSSRSVRLVSAVLLAVSTAWGKLPVRMLRFFRRPIPFLNGVQRLCSATSGSWCDRPWCLRYMSQGWRHRYDLRTSPSSLFASSPRTEIFFFPYVFRMTAPTSTSATSQTSSPPRKQKLPFSSTAITGTASTTPTVSPTSSTPTLPGI
jgi:hypothetical protein